jgi:hypothetical protein
VSHANDTPIAGREEDRSTVGEVQGEHHVLQGCHQGVSPGSEAAPTLAFRQPLLGDRGNLCAMHLLGLDQASGGSPESPQDAPPVLQDVRLDVANMQADVQGGEGAPRNAAGPAGETQDGSSDPPVQLKKCGVHALSVTHEG